MKISELIEQLQQAPQDSEVCIFDWRKNLHHADGDYQGNGIVSDFKVDIVSEDVNIPFVALSFKNDDYKEDGSANKGSCIYRSIEHDCLNPSH